MVNETLQQHCFTNEEERNKQIHTISKYTQKKSKIIIDKESIKNTHRKKIQMNLKRQRMG